MGNALIKLFDLQVVGCLLFAVIALCLFAIQLERCDRYRWPIFSLCIAAFMGTAVVGYALFVPTPYTEPVDEWTRGGGTGGGTASGGGAGRSANRQAGGRSRGEGQAGNKTGGSVQGATAQNTKAEEHKTAGLLFSDCSQCPQMVVVPAGFNNIGSRASEEAASQSEFPQIRVNFAKRFAVSQFEITLSDFAFFANATGFEATGGCNTDNVGGPNASYLRPAMSQDFDHPVVCVSANDIAQYLSWLSKEAGHTYRLLSEAEWEYVRRDATGVQNADDTFREMRREVGNIRGADWIAQTTRVGTYRPNEFRVHDMMGNVAEWTADCWSRGHEDRPMDGRVQIEAASCSHRAVRGGSWD
ncbi:MAG: SUMF1/EgtB/PvdO family nonheme iron enzyme [Pseudomonadota bacterium]